MLYIRNICCIYAYMNHCAVHLKLTQNCKSMIIQLKIIKNNKFGSRRVCKVELRRRGKSGYPVTILLGRTLDNVSKNEANYDISFPIYILPTKMFCPKKPLCPPSKRAFWWKEITRL